MPVSAFDLNADTYTRVTMRWMEPYVTEGLNKKMAVTTPHGIYRGWRLGTSATDKHVTAVADSTYGDHVAVVRGSNGNALTLWRTSGDIPLNLTSLNNSIGGLAVIALYGNFTVAAATTVECRAYTLGEWDALGAVAQRELVVLGTVLVPSSGSIPAGNISHERRSESWANVAPAAVPWAPLLKNGSFEWGPLASQGLNAFPPWTNTAVTSGYWALDNQPSHLASSAQYLKLHCTTINSAMTGSVTQNVETPTGPAKHVRLRFQLKRVQLTSAGTMSVALRYRTIAGTTTTVSEDLLPPDATSTDTVYRIYDKILTIPNGVTQVGSVVFTTTNITAPAIGAVYCFDDVQLYLETEDPLFASPETSSKGPVVASDLYLTDPTQGAQSNTVRVWANPAGNGGTGEIVVSRPDGNNASAQPQLTSSGSILASRGVTGTSHTNNPGITGNGVASGPGVKGTSGGVNSFGVLGVSSKAGPGVVGAGYGANTASFTQSGQGVVGLGATDSDPAYPGVGLEGFGGKNTAVGVQGSSPFDDGIGVKGFTESKRGIAVLGVAGSDANAAVRGQAIGNAVGGDFTSDGISPAVKSRTTGGTQAAGDFGGTGAGAGVVAQGGATGHGVYGKGGATSGTGVLGEASGTSPGAQGTAGTAGPGVKGIGSTTGPGDWGQMTARAGVVGLAVSNNSVGVFGQGGGTGPGYPDGGWANSGVAGVGTGSGAGIYGLGPAGGGAPGVLGMADNTGTSNGIGVSGKGSGTGAGVHGEGTLTEGLVAGPGGYFTGGKSIAVGGSNGPGVFAQGDTSGTAAVQCHSGGILFTGGVNQLNPPTTSSFTNMLVASSLIKAWASYHVDGSSQTFSRRSSFNMTGVSESPLNSGLLLFTFATPIPEATRCVFVSVDTPSVGGMAAVYTAKVIANTDDSHLRVIIYSSGVTAANLATGGLSFVMNVMVLGFQ